MILVNLRDRDLCSMRLACKKFKVFIDQQKCWYQRSLTAMLGKNHDSKMEEIIQRVLATKNITKMQELTAFYLQVNYEMSQPLWELAAEKGLLHIIEYCWNATEYKNFRHVFHVQLIVICLFTFLKKMTADCLFLKK